MDYNIKHCKEIKYLGLIFDNNLSWIPHINHLKHRTDNILYKISNISRPTWGLKPSVIKVIYKLVIENIILYGCFIWYKDTEKIKQKLP